MDSEGSKMDQDCKHNTEELKFESTELKTPVNVFIEVWQNGCHISIRKKKKYA